MNFIGQKFKFFLNHHLFCLQTSTIIKFLVAKKQKTTNYNFQSLNKLPKNEKRQLIYSNFFIGKIIQFCIILGITFRAFYVSLLIKNVQNDKIQWYITNHLTYHPLVTSALLNFKFFNSTVLQCTCLLAFFAIVLDYSIYFQMANPRLLEPAYQLVIENGQHFSLFDGFKINYFRIFFKNYRNELVKRAILFSSSIQNNYNYRAVLKNFPLMSPSLRVQLLVYSKLFEATAVVSGTFILGKKCF